MEDDGSSEDDERLEVVIPGDPVEGSGKVLSKNNDGGASIEPTCHGFITFPLVTHAGL